MDETALKVPDAVQPIAATVNLRGVVRRRWDVVVIGAGPAGAVAARQLALRRFDVLLVDKSQFPRDKVCGCCVNAAAITALRRAGLGAHFDRTGGRPWRKMLLGAGPSRATIDLPQGMALSRRRFDAMLVGAAVDSGVQFLPGTRATLAPTRGGPRLMTLSDGNSCGQASASVVLVADGLGGRSLRALGDDVGRVRVADASRVGGAVMVDDACGFYAPGTIHMACGDGGYVGLVRLEDGRLNVAAALDTELVRNVGGMAPAVAGIVEQCRWPAVDCLATSPWRGTPRLSRQRLDPGGRRLFVLGDAAGYVEPFTGEGIAWSLASALAVTPLASRAVAGWSPELGDMWSRRYRQIFSVRHRMCAGVVSLLRRPRWMAAVASLLGTAPGLVHPVVRALHAPSAAMEHHSFG